MLLNRVKPIAFKQKSTIVLLFLFPFSDNCKKNLEGMAFDMNKGFSVVEVVIVLIVISVLIVIAVPNFFSALISSNEAGILKAMQVLRDAEAEYFELDLDRDDVMDFTSRIGSLYIQGTLRCPSFEDGQSKCREADSLVDISFEEAIAIGSRAECAVPKTGYCIQFAGDVDGEDVFVLKSDYGWEASTVRIGRTGRHDFAVYSDGIIRCTKSKERKGNPGRFEASRLSDVCVR